MNAAKTSEVIIALSAAGLSQAEIAAKVQRNIRTVQRHLEVAKPSIDQANELLAEYNDWFEDVIPVQESAKKYAELAINAKNEAVSLGALQRIDEMRGIVTKINELRLKQDSDRQLQPMFSLPPGLTVNVTLNQVNVGSSTPQDVGLPGIYGSRERVTDVQVVDNKEE